LATGSTVTAAAAANAVNRVTVERWLQQPEFRARIAEFRSQMVNAAVGQLASKISLAATGVPSIGFCGTIWPSWLRLACAFRRVAIATDADHAGDAAALSLAAGLQSFGAHCERWRVEGAKDWNQALIDRGLAALPAANAERGRGSPVRRCR
jgi:hypothetical protein